MELNIDTCVLIIILLTIIRRVILIIEFIINYRLRLKVILPRVVRENVQEIHKKGTGIGLTSNNF